MAVFGGALPITLSHLYRNAERWQLGKNTSTRHRICTFTILFLLPHVSSNRRTRQRAMHLVTLFHKRHEADVVVLFEYNAFLKCHYRVTTRGVII